ncbi:MAG: hypothetical protein D6730_20160 [Bacteroidetes bacterium]|nr:MAG: hypothetical protein D6730_20160 [Bacteroidota bacterium]
MDFASIFQAIRRLIAQDELEVAIRRLLALFEGSRGLDEIIIQSARYNELKRQMQQMQLGRREAWVEKNKIRLALLELLREAEKGRFDDWQPALQASQPAMDRMADMMQAWPPDLPVFSRKEIEQVLEMAINQGARLYNAGEQLACALVYEYAARSLQDNIALPTAATLADEIRSGLLPLLLRQEGEKEELLLAPPKWELQWALTFGQQLRPDNAPRIAWEFRLCFDKIMRYFYGCDLSSQLVAEGQPAESSLKEWRMTARQIYQLSLNSLDLNNPGIYTVEYLLLAGVRYMLPRLGSSSLLLEHLRQLLGEPGELLRAGPFENSWKLFFLTGSLQTRT